MTTLLLFHWRDRAARGVHSAFIRRASSIGVALQGGATQAERRVAQI